MEVRDRMQICKLVAQSILADAQITDAERDLLFKLMDKYNLDDDQRKEVLARNIGDDPGRMAEEIIDSESQNELIVELALAVATDGEISSSERVLLDKVAATLKIEKEDLDLMLKAAIA